MKRKAPVESTKIVIATDNGNRLELNGKGSVVTAMVMAFGFLPMGRREEMIASIEKEHARMLVREATKTESVEP